MRTFCYVKIDSYVTLTLTTAAVYKKFKQRIFFRPHQIESLKVKCQYRMKE